VCKAKFHALNRAASVIGYRQSMLLGKAFCLHYEGRRLHRRSGYPRFFPSSSNS
jgi:hypothetical protein